ncbi:fungal-specific transcription factor domain-containing protein [Xylariaceae sp. FL0016]|nr:fungal-specific transcription factor domain-containing protein [Xylariaceae sp. FL0016]
MSSTLADSVEPKPKAQGKIRKRAPKACLSCRARKVRCDVSQRGRPCMNCYLDSETCVVTGRASRFRRSQREGESDAQASYPPYPADDCGHGHGTTAEDAVRSRDNRDTTSPGGEYDHDHDSPMHEASNTTHDMSVTSSTEAQNTEYTQPTSQVPATSYEQFFNRAPSPLPVVNEPASTASQDFAPSTGTEIPLWFGDQRIPLSADVTYSYYPFLAINNLHNIMPRDVNYLESQGCLRVPTRDILDEFVQQFFLHVHPMMPILNEGDFWDMYCQQGVPSFGEKFSLLVFQAIMFSSCNFVSKSSIKALGFPSIRAARATFYRRTKLLYDFDTESSLVCLSQTALLLSYWAPNWSHATKKPNSAWLGSAIQNAKSAEAHLYSAMPTFSPLTDPVQYKKQNTLKRLWWCCIIRDRILPLGMRRSIQITRSHFDLDANAGLGYIDLADEVNRSKVYNAETKRCLIEIFVQLGELCSVLTDLLTLVFPLDDAPGWGRRNGSEDDAKVKECKIALRRWYKGASLRFPMFGGGSVARKSTGNGKQYQHDSVILYTNLMYMYYHSARAALCHHEVLQLMVASTSPNLNSNLREFSNIYENRHELQDASSGVTECLKELVQLRLARWLPISAVASTALPLVLHIIDVKLSSHHNSLKGQQALKQHRLNILIEAMKTYQPQYDGVDYISETIRHIINLAQLDPPSNADLLPLQHEGGHGHGHGSGGGGGLHQQPAIADWTDILASQPGCYLRLAMTMDISLSKGRLARESDFPVKLRGLFAAGFSPIWTLVAKRRPGGPGTGIGLGSMSMPPPPPSTAPSHQSTTATSSSSSFFSSSSSAAAAPSFGMDMQPGTVHSLSSDEDANSPASADGGGGHGQAHSTCTSSGTADAAAHAATTGDAGAGAAMDMDTTGLHHLSSTSFMDGLSMDSIAGDVLAAYADAFNVEAARMAEDQRDQRREGHGAGGERRGSAEGESGDGEAEAEGGGGDDDWMQGAWSDDGMGMGMRGGLFDTAGLGDRDTARALLDAMKDDGVSCGA